MKRLGSLLLFVASTAFAHPPGLSRSEWTREGDQVSARMIFSRSDPAGSVSSGWALSQAGAPCTLKNEASQAIENDGQQTDLTWTCASASPVVVDGSVMFGRLGTGHRHLARHDGSEEVLHLGAPRLTVGAAAEGSIFGKVVLLGVEHILTGWDHLLFLVGLLLGAKNLKGVLKLATAFTVGHSITLALAALQIWAPPSRLTESLIAASVVYVGVQNVRRKSSERHWPLALAFGLIHGFGLAGALEAVALSGSGLVIRLFAFNLGVELGQLSVLLPLLPLLSMARKSQRFEAAGVPLLGAGVAVAGFVALVQRAFNL